MVIAGPSASDERSQGGPHVVTVAQVGLHDQPSVFLRWELEPVDPVAPPSGGLGRCDVPVPQEGSTGTPTWAGKPVTGRGKRGHLKDAERTPRPDASDLVRQKFTFPLTVDGSRPFVMPLQAGDFRR